MDWLHQQSFYEEERARRANYYDYGPLMNEGTFFTLLIGFVVVVVLVLGAHVAERSLARLDGTTEARLLPRRSAPAHATERMLARRPQR